MTDYDGLKATELKDLLKERGIASTGMTRKQQYIEALEAQDAQEGSNEATNEGEQKVDEEPVGDNADATANADSNPDQEPSDAPQQSSETADVPVTDEQPSAQTITPQVEPAAPEDQSDNLKRKRSDATPLEDDESTQKKLKSDQDATQPEDIKEDAPVPVDVKAEETVKPMPVSDDVMDVTGQEDVKDETDVKDAAERAPSTEPMAVDTAEPSDANNVEPPSTHPPTSALYIRNLLRPLQVPPFREHLLQLATPSNETPNDSLIETIHLDTFKSHAFVIFTSPSAAIRARAGLHDHIWPEETQRKALWVDFVPSDKAQTWIATETEAGKSKRFEVVYSTSPETGAVMVSLEEASQHNNNAAPSAAAAPTAPSLPGPGMPNAPTGPRGDRSQQQAPTGPAADQQPHQPQPAHHAPRLPLHTPASLSHFPSTTSSPKIFYQPVPKDLVDKRMEELERETSRDWDGGRQKPFGTALDQLRRYTFEDGDVVVDGGVDFGGFGKDRGAGGGGGHGGGFGGNGGGGGGGRRRGGRGRR